MKINTSELQGAALDWAVAKADGRKIDYDGIAYWVNDAHGCAIIGPAWKAAGKSCGYSPSSNWAHGGPIIERHEMSIECLAAGWHAQMPDGSSEQYDDVPPLVAAMRCFVDSKIGSEVEVPGALS